MWWQICESRVRLNRSGNRNRAGESRPSLVLAEPDKILEKATMKVWGKFHGDGEGIDKAL